MRERTVDTEKTAVQKSVDALIKEFIGWRGDVK